MGIEPTRAALPGLENKRFGAMTDPKCDWRVNFRDMWGHVGIREPTVVTADVLRGIAGHRTVYTSVRQLSTALRPSAFASQDPWPSTAPKFLRRQPERDRCTRLASACKGLPRPRAVCLSMRRVAGYSQHLRNRQAKSLRCSTGEYGGEDVALISRDALCGYRADERDQRSTTLIEFRPVARRPRVQTDRVFARIAITGRVPRSRSH